MKSLVCIAHNLRSTHNVGSLLRTCEGLGVDTVFLTGYTPHPIIENDTRLPHESAKISKQINKTALGAEHSVTWRYENSIQSVLEQLRSEDYQIAALEQTDTSVLLPDFKPPERLAIIIGREVEGVENEVLELCDVAIEIPMFGKKESYNVVQAAAMALYQCRFA